MCNMLHMHVQDAAGVETSQVVRPSLSSVYTDDSIRCSSFKLGGEKKIMGATLQSVRDFCPSVAHVPDSLFKVSCMLLPFLLRVTIIMYPPPHYDMQSATCSSPAFYTHGLSYLGGVKYSI